MYANGYGADLELTDQAVVIHAGKVAAKIQGTGTVSIPWGDVASIEYKPANALVNGKMRIVSTIEDVTMGETFKAGAGMSLPPDRLAALDEHRRRWAAYGGPGVNPQSLVVQWRRKDEASFAAIRDAINARTRPLR